MNRHLTVNGRSWASYREVRAYSEDGRWIIESDQIEPAVARYVQAERNCVVRIVGGNHGKQA